MACSRWEEASGSSAGKKMAIHTVDTLLRAYCVPAITRIAGDGWGGENPQKFYPCGGYHYPFKLRLNPNMFVSDAVINLTIIKPSVFTIASYRETQ